MFSTNKPWVSLSKTKKRSGDTAIFELLSLEQTVAYIRKNSINEYIAIIEELEAEKRIRPDDKTIIMIDF